VKRKGKWHVIEYNVRIGVTSGAMILRMLANPVQSLLQVGRNQKLDLKFKPSAKFGCSVTQAGYGYPYTQLKGPALPVEVTAAFDPGCDVWWNEVGRGEDGRMFTTGHRIADVIAFGPSLRVAQQRAYVNINKIRSLGSYHRTDIGQSLWPPGNN
jgi:phosphoribosylamine--glycine ligase